MASAYCTFTSHTKPPTSAHLARIRDIIVMMVNDSSFLFIKLDTTFTAQLTYRVTCRKTKTMQYNKAQKF